MNEFHGAASITRGTLVAVKDDGDDQRIEVRGYAGERFTEVVRSQVHGFTSNPPVGSTGHFLRMGESDRLFALGFETPGSRPKSIPPGGKALYDSSGKVLKFLPGQGADWNAAGQEVTIHNATKVTISGSAEIILSVGGTHIRLRPGRIDLGLMVGTHRMMTESGPSNTIYGVI